MISAHKRLLGLILLGCITVSIAVLLMKPRKAAVPNSEHPTLRIFRTGNRECEIAAPAADRTILLTIRLDSSKQLSVRINQDEVAFEDLQHWLTGIFKERMQRRVFLDIDPTAHQKYGAKLIHILQSSGVDTVCMVDPKFPVVLPSPMWAAGGAASSNHQKF